MGLAKITEHILTTVMILSGAACMLAAIFMTLGIITRLRDRFRQAWRILAALMGFFFLGYLGFIAIMWSAIPLPLNLITGAVFLGGAVFVLIVVRLSRSTVTDLMNVEDELKDINQHLEDKVEERTLKLKKAMKQLAGQSEKKEKILLRLSRLSRELTEILNTISTGILLIDKDYNILRANKGIAEMAGWSLDEIEGAKYFELFEGETGQCGLAHIMSGKNSFCITKEAVNRAGRSMVLNITTRAFRDREGNILGVVEDFQDITELVNLQKEKEKAQARLLQTSKLESVGQLAAGIAHEINTPIQYVESNLDFLMSGFEDMAPAVEKLQAIEDAREKGEVNDAILEDIADILEDADWEFLKDEIPAAIEQTKSGAQRVSSIVRAMKEFSHPVSKEKAPADLNAIIKNSITISTNEWKYDAELVAELSEDLPEVPCHADEMGQVILNMIVNAAHAIKAAKADDSAKKGKIRITTSSDGDYAVISISDNGTGMPPEVKERIFDPFFTTKEVGSGTGQGLSIAYDVVVSKHNGAIDIETREGEGTRFIIRLPLK